MYYMLECLSPQDGYTALFDYEDDDPFRSWTLGSRFDSEPITPLQARLKMRKDSQLVELWKAPLPVMSIRLHKALLAAGVDNLDVYPIEFLDPKTGKVYSDYLAFNLIGVIAAADLANSDFHAFDSGNRALDFNSLSIEQGKTKSALMFRLAEATNGIVVHESIKHYLESSGIDTLTFLPPENWAG